MNRLRIAIPSQGGGQLIGDVQQPGISGIAGKQDQLTESNDAASATKARVTSPLLRGLKERWIEAKTKTVQEGWVLMEKTTHDRIWHSGTFGDLYILD